MKQSIFLILSIFTTISVCAQFNRKSDVTIYVSGNLDMEILVDGKNVNNNNAVAGNNIIIKINDLEAGQHSLEIRQGRQNSKRAEKISTVFMLRRRFDMVIKLNANGTLELVEKIKSRNDNVAYQPMSNTNFLILLNNIKKQRTTSGKKAAITNALNTPNNYFTTSQVVQLLQQVNVESYRLELAKLSYRTITDQDNFDQVFTLLQSQASKDELNAFIYSGYDEENYSEAMSDGEFNNLYQTIKQQWPVSEQMNSLSAAFNNTNNYFTSYQASRLIGIVIAESNRLQLAKLSYRSITDPENFNQVSDQLAYQSSKSELAAYIANYQGGGPGYKIAMPEYDFNNLLQTIQQQWPVSTQMNSLTAAFNNANNYFSSNQASRLIQLVISESNRLQLAKLSYRSITDPENFNQVSDLLAFQSSKNELAAYIANYQGGGVGYKTPMPEYDFNNLFQTIQQQWPVSTQMNSLTAAFNNNNNYFSSNQASRLIQLVISESNRLQLAKLSYRSITDPANFYQVSDLLSYQSNKDELAAYVANFGGGNAGYRVAMTDADFNSLYHDIQFQFLPGAKMTAVTSAFNNQNYYFTTAQAKQLIELVSLESNRLTLAKLSYRSITDRANFNQVYDLLGSQASRDELQAYVNAYHD